MLYLVVLLIIGLRQCNGVINNFILLYAYCKVQISTNHVIRSAHIDNFICQN